MRFEKGIYDSVHGYIDFTKLELKIVDSPLFQRLRGIKQLAFVDYVFPGGTHTRFSHSIGSLFVVDQMARRVLGRKIKDSVLQKLRLAALLHDVGHFPYSHVLESQLGKHEEKSAQIVREGSIGRILEKANIDPDEIAKMILAQHSETIYNLLLSSDLDADRIDFLQRDAHETGVAFGKIDVDRIMRTLVASERGLAVKAKGKQSLEDFLLSRFYMYRSIYYHKTVAAFEEMLKRAYKLFSNEGKLYSREEVADLDEKKWNLFTDTAVLTALKTSKVKSPTAKSLARMILRRQPIRLVYEAPTLTLSGGGRAARQPIELLEIPAHAQILANTASVPSDWLFYVEPLPIHLIAGGEEPSIEVETEDGFEPITEDRSSIIYHLYQYQYLTPRIYTRSQYKSKVLNALSSLGYT